MEAEGVVCFYVSIPETKDEILFISSLPKGVSMADCRREFCRMLTDQAGGTSRDKAVLIEVIAFLAATVITVLVLCLSGKSEKKSAAK